MFKLFVILVFSCCGIPAEALKSSCSNDNVCTFKDADTTTTADINFYAVAPYSTLKKTKTAIFVNATLPAFPAIIFTQLPSLLNVTARDAGIKDIGSLGDRNARKVDNLRTLILARNKLTTLRSMAFIRLHRLTFLDVSFNQITDIDTNAFNGITEISELILSGNCLQSLTGGWLSPLVALKKLQIDKNRLTELNLAEFSGIKTMLSISAKQNKIASIVVEEVNHLMNTLYLGGNQLEDVSNLTRLPGLQTLHLKSNPLLLDEEFFEKMPQLNNLVLDDIDLNQLNGNFSIFAPLQNLALLSLSNNSLGSFVVANFPKLSKLTYLYLDGNSLTTLDFENLNIIFPKLQAIEITKNRFDCVFLKFMIEHFERIKVHLEFYDKSRNNSRFSVQGVECVPSVETINGLSSRLDTVMAVFSDMDQATNQTVEYLEIAINDVKGALEEQLQELQVVVIHKYELLEGNYTNAQHQVEEMSRRLLALEDRAIRDDNRIDTMILWAAVILSLLISSLLAVLYMLGQLKSKQSGSDQLQVAYST